MVTGRWPNEYIDAFLKKLQLNMENGHQQTILIEKPLGSKENLISN